MRAVSILAFFVLTLGFATVRAASAQRGDHGPHTEEMERRRERWNHMSEEERELMQRRFREFQELSPEERRELMERAQRLEHIQRSLRETAPEELRQEIDALEPERRERRWREHGFERTREMGRHLRENMPPELRRRLEAAPPEQRHEMFETFMRNDEGRGRRAIHWMGRKLGLAAEEIERMEELPLEEQLRVMMELKRRLIVSRVEEYGLPAELDEATWERMQTLPDEEFLNQMHATCPSGTERWSKDRGARHDRGNRGDRGDWRERREDFSRNRDRDQRF
jgi:hypothetical protein